MAGTATRLDRATGGWLAQQGEKLTQQEAWLCQQEAWLDQRGVSLVQQYSELVHQHQWMKQRRHWLDHQLRQLIQQESALIQGGESGERLSGQMYPIKLCLSSPHIFCGQSQQVLPLERFREKIIGTSFPDQLSRVFMGREHDDRKTMRGFLAFELPENRSPIRAGEPDIQEQQIRERLGHLLHGVSIPVLATCAASCTMRSPTQSARI